MNKTLTVVWQVILLSIISVAMRKLVEVLHLPIPGSILGIVFVFILLRFNILRLSWIELGANWLLAEIVLFFIPLVVGIMEYKSMLLSNGISMSIVVVLSTILVMACTGLVSQRIAKMKEHKQS